MTSNLLFQRCQHGGRRLELSVTGYFCAVSSFGTFFNGRNAGTFVSQKLVGHPIFQIDSMRHQINYSHVVFSSLASFPWLFETSWLSPRVMVPTTVNQPLWWIYSTHSWWPHEAPCSGWPLLPARWHWLPMLSGSFLKSNVVCIECLCAGGLDQARSIRKYYSWTSDQMQYHSISWQLIWRSQNCWIMICRNAGTP